MKTLKLDSSFRPVQIIDSYDAFGMIYMKRANLVESYPGEFLYSTHDRFPLPCVISLNRYVKIPKITLTCNRKNVFWRDKNTCQYCSKVFPSEELTMDHVTPRSKGGPKSWENIVTCCKKCNQKKGNKLPREADMIPLSIPSRPSPYMFYTLGKEVIHPQWAPYLGKYKIK
ncbi:MAG: hypothetical protein CBC29_06685 [Methylococcaceae bacterium TMED69]|nr:MAG: hypothetical protein CBC29_06685 [Methylococcaceae bacterium TMED69]|tara:strand:- start:2476 stop:2988 length:513 start_codon:yes stop_codon:yes gene_type:complete